MMFVVGRVVGLLDDIDVLLGVSEGHTTFSG
jgi:hypothetical protein